MNQYNIHNLRVDPRKIQHPLDYKASQAVLTSSAFQNVLKWISQNSVERMYRFLYNSSNAKITPSTSPKLSRMITEACEMFCAEEIPEMFLVRRYDMDMIIQGVKHPIITVSTEVLNCIEERGIWGMIASEAAGIKNGYCQIKFVESLCNSKIVPDVMALPLSLLFTAWHKYAQMSFDRATLVATNDFNTTIRVMLGGEAPMEALEKIDFTDPNNSYMLQCKEFIKQENGLEKAARDINSFTAKWLYFAYRYVDLYDFYHGEYNDIMEELGGDNDGI